MNPKFNSILFVIFLLLSKFILGQEVALVYHNYTTEDGLPSSEVYKSFQDEQGFMWFCTDHGLSKFNGFEFINYTEEDGLSDNVVLDYHIEKPGKVWLICNNGSLSILENGKIRPYKFNKKIKEFHSAIHIRDISIKPDALYIGTLSYNSFKINSEGEIYKLVNTSELEEFLIFDKKINLYYSGAIRNKESFVNKKKSLIKLKLKMDSSEINFTTNPDWGRYLNTSNVIEIHKSLYCLNISNHLLFFDNTSFLYKIDLPSNILFLEYEQNSLWVGLLNNGLVQLTNSNNRFEIANKYLPNTSVSYITIDSDQSLWISTLNNGIFYCVNPNIEMPFHSIPHFNNIVQIWIKDSTLFTLANNHYFRISKTYTDSIIFETQLPWKKYNGKFINGKFNLMSHDSTYNFNPETNNLNSTQTKNIGVHASFLTYGKSKSEIYTDFKFLYTSKYNSDSLIFITEDIINKIEMDRDSNLWIGSQSGLWVYDGIEIKSVVENISFNDFYFTQAGLIGASNGKGIYIVAPESLQILNKSNGLPNNQINSLSKIDDSSGWTATNSGVSHFQLSPNKKSIITNYKIGQGLISSEILNIVTNGKLLFINSKKGLIKVEVDKLKADFSSSLLLKKISINGSVLDETSTIHIQKNNLVLDSEFLSMEIELSPICLNCLNQQQIKAAINGNTQKFSDHRLILNSLKPGEYNIKFWIKNGQDQWVEANFEINFTIPTPFWQSTWFSLIIILLIVIVLFLIIFNFILFYKKNQLEKHKLIEYQQSALILQMKPHFIFNAMNSIQSEVLSGDKFETHKFISKFGLLMRKNLEYSDQEFILLQEEIDLIRMYAELENKRLNFPFQFIVDIGAGVNLSDSKIPPFILQPIIENCIWHGLTSSDIKDGEIHLKISIIDECLRIVITDNGIGLETSLKNKKNTHVSKGTLILQKRIELLEKQYNFKSSYSLKDRKHFNSRGTIIQITLPLIK
ncbi:MAG: ligand-binding sensor domain-containing protein [Flavobacteriales bacterium]|jgi:ligand-binding sensor domain-containing protein